MRTLVLLATALLATGSTLCAAAPKVSIRIVSRSSSDDAAAELGPVPFREPMVYWQGPFASEVAAYVDPLPCLKETPVTIDATAALLDVCHLKNVTLVKKPVVAADGGDGDASREPEVRKILGIYRGWKMDPITLRYKQMVFDDGDECGEFGRRMSFLLDIVAAKSPSVKPRVYEFRQLDECTFRAKLFTHVPATVSKPYDSVHTPGVLGITDANETLPQVCAQMKCGFNTIMNKVRVVMAEVRQAHNVATEVASTKTPALANFTLSSSTAILQSSNAVLERSLELLSMLERMQHSLQKQLDDATKRAEALNDAKNTSQPAVERAAVSSGSPGDDSADSESDAMGPDESSDESELEQQAGAEALREVVVEVES